MDKRVAITGIGVISPNSIGKDSFKKAIEEGKSGIKKISLFDTTGLRCKTAGEIKDFTAEDFLGKKRLRNLNRSTKLTLAATKLALDDANLPYPIEDSQAYSYGVSIGTAIGSMHSIFEFDKETLLEGPSSPNPAHFPNTTMNIAASYISIWFNVKGFNSTVASALCSGTDAIFYAINMIKNYDYKIAIAGGVDELSYETFLGFYKTGMLSGSRPGSKEFLSCPYDKRRNGLILGEGASILVLEDLEHARKRKAEIYASIEGYGFSFDPKSRRISNLKGDGAALAIGKALKDGGIKKEAIDYICGSANSTKDNDITESRAINTVFGKRTEMVPVSSIKSMLGEAFSAGGVFNIAACALAIDKGFIPPTINYSLPDERCNLNIIKNKPAYTRIGKALANSFSATGANSSVLLSDI